MRNETQKPKKAESEEKTEGGIPIRKTDEGTAEDDSVV